MKLNQKLVLFDVDGTLINRTKKSDFSLYGIALKKHFKIKNTKQLYCEGTTDPENLTMYLKANKIKNPKKHKNFKKAVSDLGNIEKEAQVTGKIKTKKIKNVEKLIKTLIKEKEITIGLLTGNTVNKAKVKLEKVELWHYFKVGAFSDNVFERSKLVNIAINDAEKKLNEKFNKKNVWLIGDTVKDIQCAKKAKVKIIAMATGPENVKQLKKENPDYIFQDFSDVQKIIEIIKTN